MERPDHPVLVVQVTRTGGVAGLTRRWSVEAGTERDARQWRTLLDACPWDAPPGECAPDGFVYEVTADDREATLPEQQLDGPWRTLVEAVQAAHHPEICS